MDLRLKDVAELLNVSKTTIRRWLADGRIPAYRINNQYRFNRNEIEDWVMRHRVDPLSGEEVSSNSLSDDDDMDEPSLASSGGTKQFSLYRAINKGGVLYQVPGLTKEQVIRNSMAIAAKSLSLDGEVLTDLLLDREKLMPTALGSGIGVPHTRDFLLNGQQDAVIVAFPERPIQYGALDGKLVHTLFFLFACDDKRHLHLLAKIAHLSSQPETLELLRSRPPRVALLEYVKNWEAQIPQQRIPQ